MPQSAVVGGAQWSYGVWVGLILYPSITYALDSYLHSRSVTPPPTPPPHTHSQMLGDVHAADRLTWAQDKTRELMHALTHPSTTHTCAANQLRRVHRGAPRVGGGGADPQLLARQAQLQRGRARGCGQVRRAGVL